MMTEKQSLAKLEPLFFGRLTRVAAGAATLFLTAELWSPAPGDILLAVALALLGASFLVGGLMGNPGCEITVLPNLVLPPEKRLHCV